jgi:hypothetical protein
MFHEASKSEYNPICEMCMLEALDSLLFAKNKKECLNDWKSEKESHQYNDEELQ